MESFVKTINDTENKPHIIREHVHQHLKDLLKPSLQYLDSHRYSQAMKALIVELTSVNFAAKLQGITSRQGTSMCQKVSSLAIGPVLHNQANLPDSSE